MSNPIHISFQAPVTQQSSGQLQAVLTNAINARPSEIVLYISSPGGSVFDGMNAATLIKASPIPITIHNVGQIDSIAGVIYSAGVKRLAQNNSSFLFHGVMANFAGPTSLTEQQLEERLATLRRDRENIARNISQYSGAVYEKIDELMKAGAIISAQEAKNIGLVHDIVEAKIPEGVQLVTIA